MRKLLLQIIALAFGTFVFGQNKINSLELQKISVEKSEKYLKEKELEKVRFANFQLPRTYSFQGFFDNAPLYARAISEKQRKSMNSDNISNGSVTGTPLSGTGFTAYIWDEDEVRTTHIEFGGRAQNVETSGYLSDHSTAVAGVIMGSGQFNYGGDNSRGIAHNANLKSLNFQDGNTLSEIAYESGLSVNQNYMVSNHSYGYIAGWEYISSYSSWFWFGFPHISATESVLFGHYIDDDEELDQIAYNAPQHSMFAAAGNSNNYGPGGANIWHYVLNSSGNFEQVRASRPDNCTQNGGYDCIPNGSVAKNIILVGAVKPITNSSGRYSVPGDVKATDFTSFGPTDDGRIKPDVTAIGQDVLMPTTSNNNAYTLADGTSFSSPAAAGVGVLLQQVKNDFDGEYLRSDMMKALLINSAFESGDYPGPDYKFGYGLINAQSAAETIINKNNNSYTEDRVLENGETHELYFNAKGGEPLKVTIAWIDPPGTPLSYYSLNNRTPMLVNDLDLRVIHNSTTYYPWKLDVENPGNAATKGDNVLDNVEQVVINSPVAGDPYKITIGHKGSLSTPGNPPQSVNYQNYAIVITGVDNMFCYRPANISGSGLSPKMGITTLDRGYSDNSDNWPEVRKGGWLVLESKTEGFVLNRVKFNSSGNPVNDDGVTPAITQPVEGMMVYDTTNKCLKLYTSVDEGATYGWYCIETQTCPDN